MIKANRKIFLVSDLVPADYNPRKINKKQQNGLKKSLDKFGYLQDIIVNIRDNKNIICGGHRRLEELGLKPTEEIECTIVDLSELQEKALNVALNNRHTSGDFDTDGLEKILSELKDGLEDFDDLNFDDLAVEFDFDFEDEPPGDGDNIPEVPEDPVIKFGDLIEFGDHRLLCGDSTDKEQVERLMNGEKADMVFTDPPYGMNLDTDYTSMVNSDFKGTTGGNEYNKVKGDNSDFSPELINTIFENFKYCKEIFLWGADYYSDLLQDRNSGSWVVWDKRLTESSDKMYGSTFELCWSKTRHKRMLARVKWAGIFGMETQDTKKRVHPTQKPVELAVWFFDYYSLKNKLNIVDLYLGSGTTLIACEKTNRKCYGMELDEKYCQVIIQRWIDYTGNSEIKINGELINWNDYKAVQP